MEKTNPLIKISEKYNSMSAPLKASFWFVICNIILKGVSFITTPILTRLLPSAEYGVLSTYVSYEQIIGVFTAMGIAPGAYQRGIYKYKDDVEFYTASTLLFTTTTTLLFFGVIFLVFPWFSAFTEFNLQITILMMFYIMFGVGYSCWMVRSRAKFKYQKVVALTLLCGVSTLVMPLLAVMFVDKTANIKYGTQLFVSILIYVFVFFPSAKFLKLRKNIALLKEQWLFTIRFQIPLIPQTLACTVLAQIDRVMIKNLVGASQAAYYSVAYSLGMLLHLVTEGIGYSVQPWLYASLDAKDYKGIRKNMNWILIGIGLMLFAFVLVAPEGMRFLFSDEYYEAVWCIPPVAMSIYFMFLFLIFVWVQSYFEVTKYAGMVAIICTIFNIVANLICIDIFGYIACAYTTVVTYGLHCLLHYLGMRRVVRQKDGPLHLYNMKLICAISIGLLAGEILITMLYPYWIVRYALVLVGLLALVWKRNAVIDFVKTIKR